MSASYWNKRKSKESRNPNSYDYKTSSAKHAKVSFAKTHAKKDTPVKTKKR